MLPLQDWSDRLLTCSLLLGFGCMVDALCWACTVRWGFVWSQKLECLLTTELWAICHSDLWGLPYFLRITNGFFPAIMPCRPYLYSFQKIWLIHPLIAATEHLKGCFLSDCYHLPASWPDFCRFENICILWCLDCPHVVQRLKQYFLHYSYLLCYNLIFDFCSGRYDLVFV